MVRVAVAGASGGVGKAIVKALAAQSKHEYISLSRSSSDDPNVVQVDYNDVDGLVATLQQHQIQTVISGLSLVLEHAVQAQNNLIKAADRASSVRRFIPSDYGPKLDTPENSPPNPQYQGKIQGAKLLKETGLEFTRLYNCFFMDYMASPFIPSDQKYSPNVFIDLENNFAAIPGDGTSPFIMTHTSDIAKFAVAALDLDKWDPWYLIVGSRQTLLEAVQIAEEEKGVKFEVVFDPVEKLLAKDVTLTPLTAKAFAGNQEAVTRLKTMLSPFSEWLIEGAYDMEHDVTLNGKFPEMRALTYRDVVRASVKK